jgi:hypothetical protein
VGNERVSIVEALKRLRELGTTRRYTVYFFSHFKPVRAEFEQQPTEQQQDHKPTAAQQRRTPKRDARKTR